MPVADAAYVDPADPRPTALDVICRRCLTPGRGWRWDGEVRCEPCHRVTRGDNAVDSLILSHPGRLAEWWTDDLCTDLLERFIDAELSRDPREVARG